MIAVVETTDKYPICTLWDPDLCRKKKTLTLPSDKDIYCNRFVAVDFTFDSKFIVLVTGEPDFSLYCFKCDKGRLDSFARANNTNSTGTVTQVACNPNDPNQLVVIGDSVLRCLGCSEFTWRQFGYGKVEYIVYTSCCWLSQDRLAVGTAFGRLMMLEAGELRAVFNANDLPFINMKLREELDDSSQTSLTNVGHSDPTLGIMDVGENYEIRSIVNFNRGFAFGILVSCLEMQIWTARIWAHDNNTGPEINMKDFGYTIHMGPVVALAVCRWKPIVISAGSRDRSLKIWNYESLETELVQNFEDDIFSVALHPTGLYAVVGFSDKLRFMTIMIDDILNTKEFNIRACRLTSFSKLGHMFAATNGNIIQIYSSINFQQMYVLKGHNGEITSMSWSFDDSILATTGSEGAVYGWDIASSTRQYETIIKSNNFKSAAISKDSRSIYAVGTDGHLRELMNSNVYRDVVIADHQTPLDAVVLSALDTMLFVSGNQGVIYNVKLPLMEKAEFIEYMMHSNSAPKMVLSSDDRYMITGTVDGYLCFWKLLNIEDKAIKLDLVAANEILISKHVLEEKMETIKNLSLRMKELETEHSYQVRQNEAVHALKMKDIHAGYCNAIEELKLKNEQMEAEHLQEINNINAQITKKNQDHQLFVQKLEASYNEKLIVEYNKYISMESKMEQMLKEEEERYQQLKHEKEESEKRITKDFLQQLNEKQILYDDLLVELREKAKEHELIKQQIEDDADREICELKVAHEKELKEEQDLNIRLRGESAVVKKKFLAAQKDSEDLKHQVYSMEAEHIKFKNIIVGLERENVDNKKEIQERDQTIEEKEKRIFQLKGKNQELEKFKFILDFKIKELKSQIEPRERTIQEQITQINEMVRELENLQKVILNLDLQLAELREKLSASNNEVKREIEKNRRMKKALQAIRIDIHHASGLIKNVPALQKAVRDMYHKYDADKDFEVTQAEDTEAKSEFLRQRDFLERTVATLHYQATKSTTVLSYDKVRLVDENAALLVETNKLRKNLQEEINQKQKLNSLVGLSYISPKQAQQKVNTAAETNKQIHTMYKNQIEENDKTINALKEENNRLLNKIAEIDYSESKEDDLLKEP
ncbi:unnamed protein product [Acanthoscelides obtectus]|uniref:Cilia- and flagella-associated protein 57 n=1 Tax=Acanthoscelides obtectus TaxID=200917 RepID=A0A9P0Q1B3_ACAOB|nr:unnamed protein product [Acanthoscelides obtectus]CAK1651593.1 Cilia- and flagella-associated protein 57 [Acanthoscelides obtectus]